MGNRFSGFIGSIVMLCFGAMSFYRFYTTGIIFFLLMVFRDALAAWYFISRNENTNDSSSKLCVIVAYISSALPLFYFRSVTSSATTMMYSSLISISGFLLSTLALIELGKSFGVSPTNRGIITTGVYRFVKHPMYLGYFISEFGLLLINPLNIIIYIISIILYSYRSKIEDKVLISGIVN